MISLYYRIWVDASKRAKSRYVTPFNIQNGNKYKIWRNNGNIEFYVNNTLDRTFVDQYPNRPMYLEVAFNDPNKKIKNLYIYKEVRKYFEEITDVQTFTKDGNYRYQFNGMEVDNEVKGNGNSYTTEFRQYDPRLGRWLSLDPMMNQRVSYTPYNFGRNNPIIMVDPSGALDDWYEDEDGNVEWYDDDRDQIQVGTFSDDYSTVTYKTLKNIGKQLTSETSGIGSTESALFSIFMNGGDWSDGSSFKGTGINVSTSQSPEYYHPLQNSPGFAADRITSNANMFVANEAINSGNFSDAMMGAFIGGAGPENFYFGTQHSASQSMVNSEIAFMAIKDFQARNKNWTQNGVQPLPWTHYSQSASNLAWSAFGSLNEGGGRPTTVENFIGGAAISITPIGTVNANYVKARVTIFNVTSVGSGNVGNGQSFPRPIGVNSAQPYTNINQVMEFDVLIGL